MDLIEIKNKATAKLEETLNRVEEPNEEVVEEVVEEPIETETIEETTEQPTESVSERESALLKEISRLRASKREESFTTHLDEIPPTVEEAQEETMEVTPAEARLFTAWRNEALEELFEKYPKYRTDARAWENFVKEYSDRVPELTVAKRNKTSVTKSLFRERMERVHRSLEDGSSSAREEGKKELLKAQSAASVMGAGAAKGSQPNPEAPAQRKHLLPKKSGGFESWITKK